MKFTSEQYEARIRELFAKHPSVQTSGFTAGAYKAGLQGIGDLDARLGHPWRNYSCVHVAGTNGKGSVSSMMAAALSGRMRVGLYTSPHILDFRERMKIISPDGCEMISRSEVWEFLDEVQVDGLSFFEVTTGMAFRWFARRGVDAAVIEVGLGGRLDSTNIITPAVSIVTSIGLDHCALLGDTREKIAFEKAGIFKPGVPAVVWGRDEETAPVFGKSASEAGAPLVFAGQEPAVPGEAELSGSMDIQGPCGKVNLRTVLSALKALGVDPADRDVQDRIRRAAALTGFHGRWERLCSCPEVICDIGHNAQALSFNFKRLEDCGRPLHIVYGIMADKDLDAIAPLMPRNEAKWYLCAPAGERSLPAGALLEKLSALRPDLDLRAFPSVAEAVSAALEEASKDNDSLVYIGGSTYVVAEAVPLFKTQRP